MGETDLTPDAVEALIQEMTNDDRPLGPKGRKLLAAQVYTLRALSARVEAAEKERDTLRTALNDALDRAQQRWGDLQPPIGQAQINEADHWWEMAEALRAAIATDATRTPKEPA